MSISDGGPFSSIVRVDVLGPEAATLEDLVPPSLPLARRNTFGQGRTDVGQTSGFQSLDIGLQVRVEA
jgi:hypothetical protein